MKLLSLVGNTRPVRAAYSRTTASNQRRLPSSVLLKFLVIRLFMTVFKLLSLTGCFSSQNLIHNFARVKGCVCVKINEVQVVGIVAQKRPASSVNILRFDSSNPLRSIYLCDETEIVAYSV